MDTVSISVTEASRNFADCVNLARYQGMTFILEKNSVQVARIVPVVHELERGQQVAAALGKAVEDVHREKRKRHPGFMIWNRRAAPSRRRDGSGHASAERRENVFRFR